MVLLAGLDPYKKMIKQTTEIEPEEIRKRVVDIVLDKFQKEYPYLNLRWGVGSGGGYIKRYEVIKSAYGIPHAVNVSMVYNDLSLDESVQKVAKGYYRNLQQNIAHLQKKDLLPTKLADEDTEMES